MDIFIIIIAVLFGLIIGSFLNVCICRIPEGKSVAFPPSHCPKCNVKIKWYDNVPVLSYIILCAKCRHCKEKISWQYPVVELLTGLLTGLFVYRYGITIWTGVVLVVVYSLIISSVIDIKIMIIPDRFSIGLIVWGLAFFWCNPNFSGTTLQMFGQSLLGAAVGFGGLLAVALLGYALFRKEAMGGGDIKLMGGVGALLGWQGVITTLVIACLIGLVYSIFLMVTKRADKGSAIPFGPFLSFGALVNLFYFISPSLFLIRY
ncbi:Type II secretion system subunit [Elusimicrobium minutum Pei191]|uniref:Prepilin leader peptidase/N-methyltransferase n=1 Tax=Elusimicrobium minutum (strain Pei191) TaxID=445932 RepID=B2KB39_ELUMP|nr:A24 family peptidase [Elusimicrobium minutum]ACC97798.1 Type II secretion system subunit [Elusimicrobium minutum Pei191]